MGLQKVRHSWTTNTFNFQGPITLKTNILFQFLQSNRLVTVSHTSTHLFLAINQQCGHYFVPILQRRNWGHREVNPLLKITSWEEAGLGFELRQLGFSIFYGHPSNSCPVILPSYHEVQMSWWMIKHLEKHKIIMQAQGVLWTAGFFTRYSDDSWIWLFN